MYDESYTSNRSWVAARGSLRVFYAEEIHPSFRVEFIAKCGTLFNYETLPLAAIIRYRSERESGLRKVLSTSSRFELTQLIVLPVTTTGGGNYSKGK